MSATPTKPAKTQPPPIERTAAAMERIARAVERIVELMERDAPKEIAKDSDLDSQWGDAEIKFDPRDWTGPVFAGRRMSETTPDYLDTLAESLEYAASHPKKGKEQYAEYNRRDAARARGWAARLRNGWKPDPSKKTNGTSAPSTSAPSTSAPGFTPPTFTPPTFTPPPSTMSSGAFAAATGRPEDVGDSWEPPDDPPPPAEEPPAAPPAKTIWDD